MKKKSIEKYKVELKEIPLELSGDFKIICCPSCSKEVPATDLNINDKIGKCTSCNAVFPFHQEITSLLSPSSVKQEVIRPEGIDVFHFKDELDLTLQQPIMVLEAVPLTILPVFSALITAGIIEDGLSLLWLLLAWLPMVLIVANLIYRSKHKIHINIDDKYLSILRRPKKFIKDKYIPIQEIDQIYIKSNGAHHSLHMIVNGEDGQKHQPLITNLTSASKARYLEQEIERHLGIEDRSIPEES